MSASARIAEASELDAAGVLLDRFNSEFDEPTPGPDRLASRLRELEADGDTVVLLAGDGPDGVCVIRFQPSIWSTADEAYVAEMYVVPERRRRGLGGALMEAALAACRERGCDYVFLASDEGDTDAHRLYQRFGLACSSNPEAPVSQRERIFVFEREL